MQADFLQDLDLLVVLAQLGLAALQAFWDRRGQKASVALQAWTANMVNLAPKALQDFPVYLENRVYRFLQFQDRQERVEILEALVLDTQGGQDLLVRDLPDLAEPQAPSALLGMETLALLALSGLPVRSDLPVSDLQVLVEPLGLQVPMVR